jgi:hypothetical protein
MNVQTAQVAMPTKQMNVQTAQVGMPLVVRPYVPIPQVARPQVRIPIPEVEKIQIDEEINAKDMVNVLEEIKKMMIDQGDKISNIMLEQREMVRRHENVRNNIIEVVRYQSLCDAKLNVVQLSQEEMKTTMREIMEIMKIEY